MEACALSAKNLISYKPLATHFEQLISVPLLSLFCLQKEPDTISQISSEAHPLPYVEVQVLSRDTLSSLWNMPLLDRFVLLRRVFCS